MPDTIIQVLCDFVLILKRHLKKYKKCFIKNMLPEKFWVQMRLVYHKRFCNSFSFFFVFIFFLSVVDFGWTEEIFCLCFVICYPGRVSLESDLLSWAYWLMFNSIFWQLLFETWVADTCLKHMWYSRDIWKLLSIS